MRAQVSAGGRRRHELYGFFMRAGRRLLRRPLHLAHDHFGAGFQRRFAGQTGIAPLHRGDERGRILRLRGFRLESVEIVAGEAHRRERERLGLR